MEFTSFYKQVVYRGNRVSVDKYLKYEFKYPFEPETGLLNDFGVFEINQYDYNDTYYPIPFNQLYNNKSNYFSSAYYKNLPPFVSTGDIKSYDAITFQSDILFITGASDNHAIASFNILYSFVNKDPNACILYMDYGLNSTSISVLLYHLRQIHGIHQAINSTARLYLRRYNFSSFPIWMTIENRYHRGGYTWKSISYVTALKEWKAMIGWSDAGNLLRDNWMNATIAARAEGIYTPISEGNITTWTYPTTIEYLIEQGIINRDMDFDRSNGCGGYVYFDARHPSIWKNIINPLYQCSFTQKCVQPKKCDRRNHRQDQAVLSTLIAFHNYTYSTNPMYDWRASFWVDGVRDYNNTVCKRVLFDINNKWKLGVDYQVYL